VDFIHGGENSPGYRRLLERAHLLSTGSIASNVTGKPFVPSPPAIHIASREETLDKVYLTI
jgi:hypothetical protein